MIGQHKPCGFQQVRRLNSTSVDISVAEPARFEILTELHSWPDPRYTLSLLYTNLVVVRQGTVTRRKLIFPKDPPSSATYPERS